MAGIKIHQYPLERTSIGDEDYYDIDYYTGSGYQSAKIKGSTLKNVLGANYIDIQDFTSGYTLKPTDAGKLITNAGSPFRDLIVDTTLQAPGHGFTVKGRVEIKPAVGVNIDLPDGSTITNPNSFICGSESFYVLQRKGFTGSNWILVEVKKSENLATNDLTQEDFTRNYNFPNGNYSLRFIQGAFAHMVLDTVGGSPTLLVGKNSNGTALHVNKLSGSGDAFLVQGGNTTLERRLELNSVTNGFLMNRVTTLQMNAIATPSTNELVFNTDLNALYRYNGSSWVALSSGYGIIGVYSGTGNGTPTFFADLQSAFETCKASGGYFTVKLYSNITITSAIQIEYTGSGVGNAYQFRQLTIDFNGFSVTNAQANTSDGFDVRFSNSASVYQNVTFLNGRVLRTNGTGTHFGLFADGYGTIQMEKMYWFCENHITARIHTQVSTANQSNKYTDLGGSTFVSQNHTALGQNDNTVSAQYIRNFNAIAYGAQPTIRAIEGTLSDFTSENTSTGIAVNLETTAKAEKFYAKSNSGNCVNISGGLIRSFRAISATGRAVNVSTSGNRCDVDDFYCETGNNFALFADNDARITNGKCVNNGATDCVRLFVFNSATNIEATNIGSGVGMNILNLYGGRTEVVNCKAISFGGIGGIIDAQSGQICNVDNCNFVSEWNNAGGHALRVAITTGTIKLTNCNLKVKNSGANAINATSPVTVNSRYCTHNDVASTPINANVTIVSSGIIS